MFIGVIFSNANCVLPRAGTLSDCYAPPFIGLRMPASKQTEWSVGHPTEKSERSRAAGFRTEAGRQPAGSGTRQIVPANHPEFQAMFSFLEGEIIDNIQLSLEIVPSLSNCPRTYTEDLKCKIPLCPGCWGRKQNRIRTNDRHSKPVQALQSARRALGKEAKHSAALIRTNH